MLFPHAVPRFLFFFFSSRRRHTRSTRDWSSDVCSSDLCKSSRMGNTPGRNQVAPCGVRGKLTKIDHPMSSTVYKVLGATIAVAVAAWWLHDKLRDSKINAVREKQHSQQQQRATDTVKAAVARHGAIVGWEERFAK